MKNTIFIILRHGIIADFDSKIMIEGGRLDINNGVGEQEIKFTYFSKMDSFKFFRPRTESEKENRKRLGFPVSENDRVYRAPREHNDSGEVFEFANLHFVERLSQDRSILNLILGGKPIYSIFEDHYCKRKPFFDRSNSCPNFKSYGEFLVYALKGMMEWYIDQIRTEKTESTKHEDPRLDYIPPQTINCILGRQYAQLILDSEVDKYQSWDEGHIVYDVQEVR